VTFRSQLNSDLVLASLGPCTTLTASDNVVVFSYAAHAIERIAMIKNASVGDHFSSTELDVQAQTLVTPTVLEPHVPALLTNLFAALRREATGQSDYAIKCIVRVIAVLGANAMPFIGTIVDALGEKMLEVD